MSRVTIGSLQIPRNASARHTHIDVNNKKQMESMMLNGLLEELANESHVCFRSSSTISGQIASSRALPRPASKTGAMARMSGSSKVFFFLKKARKTYDGGWIFKEFGRKILCSVEIAYIDTPWRCQPRVHDPQILGMSRAPLTPSPKGLFLLAGSPRLAGMGGRMHSLGHSFGRRLDVRSDLDRNILSWRDILSVRFDYIYRNSRINSLMFFNL
jgi:hypothetical protein